ncbi:MAG: SRPBCC domain-containing protein [Steroidobacteraceae bacterium]
MTKPLSNAANARAFEIYIRASAQAIWDAITSPDWTARYGHRALHYYELRAGGRFTAKANDGMKAIGLPEIIIDGEVLEADAPRQLVQTFRFLFTEANRSEGYAKLTWTIEPKAGGFCRLAIFHEFGTGDMPLMESAITSPFNDHAGGGWNWILSDLKSVLETGHALVA